MPRDFEDYVARLHTEERILESKPRVLQVGLQNAQRALDEQGKFRSNSKPHREWRECCNALPHNFCAKVCGENKSRFNAEILMREADSLI